MKETMIDVLDVLREFQSILKNQIHLQVIRASPKARKRNYRTRRIFGPEVGIEKFRKNLIGISLEFHENFKETECISDVDCIQ
jgi:hypothetical protein